MQRSLTETQVLKKLNIEDFRHLTKDKVISMATMLDKMDPEVAKKALEQFPEFASTMRQILSEYKKSLDEGLKQNAEGVKSYYDTCDAIITSCQRELDKEDLSFEERSFILEQMVLVAKMKGEKNTEDKKFIVMMSVIGLAAVGLTAGAFVTALGGSFKVDTDAMKKLTK
jgi:hypothetical protein